MFPKSLFPAHYFSPPTFPPGVGVWLGDFTESGIVNVSISNIYTDIYITWDIDSEIVTPPATYQVYIDGQLRWSGDVRRATIPGVPSGRDVTVHVGRVAPANRDIDYSAGFTAHGNRARLTWEGGRWIDEDLTGFNIYVTQGPGAAGTDMTRPVASVPAAPGGGWGDGFGRGPFGRAPFGRGSVSYEWTSPPLTRGLWTFAVASIDRMGTLSADPPAVTIEIVGPPSSPPAGPDGRKVWIESYDETTRVARIRWNPSS
jgi:hypothetical protein